MTRGGMTRIGAAAKIRPAVHALTARAPASLLWPISSPCSSNTLMPSTNSCLRVIPRLRTSAAATAQNGTIFRAIPALQTIWRLKWGTHKLPISSGNQGGNKRWSFCPSEISNALSPLYTRARTCNCRELGTWIWQAFIHSSKYWELDQSSSSKIFEEV